MIKKSLFTALLIIAFANPASAELSSEQQAAKIQGITFYNQYKAVSATPFLTIAAEAGDHEAQYYLGESLRRKNHYMNPEARKWYEASAAQGDLYAMIQLGRSEKDLCTFSDDCSPDQKMPIEWLNQAKHIAMPKAIQGDAEAMYVMYELTVDDEWLEKSAVAGNAFAQYWMGVGYQQGEGFFLPWKRREAVEKWFKASAEGGYPKCDDGICSDTVMKREISKAFGIGMNKRHWLATRRQLWIRLLSRTRTRYIWFSTRHHKGLCTCVFAFRAGWRRRNASQCRI